MDTSAVIAIVVLLAIIAIVLLVALPKARQAKQEREVVNRRSEVADQHRSESETHQAKARLAEQEAAKARAEADLHATKAELHDKGLADDELGIDTPPRERITGDRDATSDQLEPGSARLDTATNGRDRNPETETTTAADPERERYTREPAAETDEPGGPKRL